MFFNAHFVSEKTLVFQSYFINKTAVNVYSSTRLHGQTKVHPKRKEKAHESDRIDLFSAAKEQEKLDQEAKEK